MPSSPVREMCERRVAVTPPLRAPVPPCAVQLAFSKAIAEFCHQPPT